MTGIRIETDASQPEQDQVLGWLREFNGIENGEYMRSLSDGAEQPLILVARQANQVVGGLFAVTVHKWLKINLMAVQEHYRRKSVGRSLVQQAELIGHQRGCEFAYVDTMSYQAPEFYAGLGYVQCGCLENWDSHGHDKLFFSKSIISRDDGGR